MKLRSLRQLRFTRRRAAQGNRLLCRLSRNLNCATVWCTGLVSAYLQSRQWPTPNAYADAVALSVEQVQSSASVNIGLRPATPWVRVGEEVTYEIFLSPQGIGTAAAEISLSYGSDLELVAVKPGPYLGVQTIPGPATIDAAKRESTHVWARVGPTPDPAQPGVLAYVTFRATSARPWNVWVKQDIRLVDAGLSGSPRSSSSFDLQVYSRLPVPNVLSPGSRTALIDAGTGDAGTGDAGTGPHATFRVRTLSPASLMYRIQVSRDNFESIAYTFNQARSLNGWDRGIYRDGQAAEFISPTALEPGDYQWRASAWIAEIDQWTDFSETLFFVVKSETIGLSRLSPSVISRFQNEQRQVEIEGWGFLPGTTVVIESPQGSKTPVTVERLSDGKLSAAVPSNVGPGLASIHVTNAVGKRVTSPILIMPPALYSTTVDIVPASGKVVPGRPFHVFVNAHNWGTDDESVALVLVRLPDASVFELVATEPAASVEVLHQDQNTALLAMSGGSSSESRIIFEFRLLPELVAISGIEDDRPINPHDYLDLVLKAQVLGEVSQGRWDQMRSSMTVGEVVQAVQAENQARLSRLAQTFNQIPQRELGNQLGILISGDESPKVVYLITRMQGHGLDMSKIFGAFFQMNGETQAKAFREYRYATGVWP